MKLMACLKMYTRDKYTSRNEEISMQSHELQ